MFPPPPPKILHNHCFQFVLGITAVPKEIQDNGCANLWGVNKVHYGLCENGELLVLELVLLVLELELVLVSVSVSVLVLI